MPTKSSSSSRALGLGAGSRAPALSWPKRNSRSGATTFSSTVISWNRRVIWNVRPIPRYARRHGRRPSIRSPSNQTSPASARHRAADQVEDRRLARAVRADQRGDRALGHGERAAVDGAQAAEVLLEALDLAAARGRSAPAAAALGPLAQLEPRADQARLAARAARLEPLGAPTAGCRAAGTARPAPSGRRTSAAARCRRPSSLLANSFSGSIRNAPSTGPHSVPRPPSSIESRIWTLSRMLNIPRGSMNDR